MTQKKKVALYKISITGTTEEFHHEATGETFGEAVRQILTEIETTYSEIPSAVYDGLSQMTGGEGSYNHRDFGLPEQNFDMRAEKIYERESIRVNARFELLHTNSGDGGTGYDVFDRLSGKRVFSNANEAECRAWIARNFIDPAPHTGGEWSLARTCPNQLRHIAMVRYAHFGDGADMLVSTEPIGGQLSDKIEEEAKANAALLCEAPTLLRLLRNYCEVLPSPEAERAILRAEGWGSA